MTKKKMVGTFEEKKIIKKRVQVARSLSSLINQHRNVFERALITLQSTDIRVLHCFTITYICVLHYAVCVKQLLKVETVQILRSL